ncbi:MAG: DNA-binding response regulator [Anaerolineaceae bacterium 4572_78]|nr:MAG: DNA-binding response regulator [Anaerolineaceae bacterium 4572_78]
MKEQIKIVLADDHAVVRAGTRKLLERNVDIKIVGEAVNGFEVIQLVKDLSPDIVIMDLRMPDMSGVEATKQIKEMYPEVAVIALTAHDDDEYVFALMQAGANGYLLKTSEADEIVKAIRTVLKGELALSPSIAGKIVTQFASGKTLPDVLANMKNIYDGLTKRELNILRLVGTGLTNKQVGHKLYISDRTVQAHLSNIFSKLDVNTRTEAVIYAVRKGWITGKS